MTTVKPVVAFVFVMAVYAWGMVTGVIMAQAWLAFESGRALP